MPRRKPRGGDRRARQITLPSRWVRIPISLFVLLNIFTVLYANRPPELIEWGRRQIEQRLSPQTAYRISRTDWNLSRYAYLAGLDNRWEMFGRQSRFNWWYVVKAQYGETEPVVLPLPLQSERSFWQSVFFDFREAKFHLNMYAEPGIRAAYSSYLHRQYPQRHGTTLTSLIWERHHQNILPREQASRLGRHLDGEVHVEVLEIYDLVMMEVSPSGRPSTPIDGTSE